MRRRRFSTGRKTLYRDGYVDRTDPGDFKKQTGRNEVGESTSRTNLTLLDVRNRRGARAPKPWAGSIRDWRTFVWRPDDTRNKAGKSHKPAPCPFRVDEHYRRYARVPPNRGTASECRRQCAERYEKKKKNPPPNVWAQNPRPASLQSPPVPRGFTANRLYTRRPVPRLRKSFRADIIRIRNTRVYSCATDRPSRCVVNHARSFFWGFLFLLR